MTIRYGLIGSGMMGREHIVNLNLVDGCSVAAVADPDQAMRDQSVDLAAGDATAYADYKDMLNAERLDALLVASPNDTHHAIMLDLLETDLPILCEKPLCTTAAHCRELIRRAHGRTAPVWVAMEYRYMPPVSCLLDKVRSGTAGHPVMVSIREHRFPFLPKVGNWNRFNVRTGGTLVEKCCHFWDLMRLILNSNPVRVYASANMDINHRDERYDGQAPDIIDNAYVIVDFENGARAMLDLCMFAEGSRWQEVISVTGPEARLDARVPGPARFSVDGVERLSEVEISRRGTKNSDVQIIDVDHRILGAGDHHGSTYFQHEKFRDMILGGSGKPEVSLEDGLWSVLVGEAAEKSARTCKPVEIRG